MFSVMSRAASSSSGSHDGSRCSCDGLRLWFSDPISRPGAKPGNAIAGIGALAAFQRQTPAPYALGESLLKAFKFGNALINAVARQLGQLLPNFLKRQPDLLSKYDERDPAENRARVAPMAAPRPFRRDKSFVFIETECRGGHPAATRDLGNREQIVHLASLPHRSKK